MSVATNPIKQARARVGEAIFLRVAGPDGYEARDRIHLTPGPRWFPPESAVRVVHADAATFAGGLRALLLQSLHPLAMAGVAGHSGYRSDPWGRLARTATFLAETIHGTADDAQAAVDRVRAVHERIRGRTADGTPYRASDPHLLTWVHAAEADSFLTAHQHFGARRLSPAQADEYVAQIGRVASALGAQDVPRTVDELAACLDAYRPELRPSPEALDTTQFLLREPPLPGPVRAPYALLAAGAVATLPTWARTELGLQRWPDGAAARLAGRVAVSGIRWSLGATPPPGRR
ncbi:oxygenase MpaB family protein [Antribacter gilvus]|uniref:oxygenase MpaB family protein n=1 Tax=Antribacter gilvus TaxID=2304675 RepID=UPI000F793EA3|nr:oxygenase MpaB family protein [Antribacter gilvus]